MNETGALAATNDTNLRDDEKKDDTTATTTTSTMTSTTTTSAVAMMKKRAVDHANEMTRRGTTYLHTKICSIASADADASSSSSSTHETRQDHNPTGAVVVPISLATTFQQHQPGVARAPNDPNSFGVGYEYSRTGKPRIDMIALDSFQYLAN